MIDIDTNMLLDSMQRKQGYPTKNVAWWNATKISPSEKKDSI